MVVGWTHPQGARYYGSYPSPAELLEHCANPSEPNTLHDLEGLYHVTTDDKAYPPYFDLEWTSTQEEAFNWISLVGVIDDICAAMWHMFGVNLTLQDFVVADASGTTKGVYKHSYHIVIRPAIGPGISLTKQQLTELLKVCLQPKYKVKDLGKPTLGKDIIDPCVYRTNNDFRMVYQSKPGGERPLHPITHLDSPLEAFLLDFLPSDATCLQSRLPAGAPPPLPAQLAPRDPPEGSRDGGSNNKSSGGKSEGNTRSASNGGGSHCVDAKQGQRDRMFSFLTTEGALWLTRQVLHEAGIHDITPTNLQQGHLHRVYCTTDKKMGRDCHAQPGERHTHNNVVCTLDRDGMLYYTCMAEACGRQRKAVGSWVTHLSIAAGLATHKPCLIDLGAVDNAMRELCSDTKPEAPTYGVLKTVFELTHFRVTTPHSFVRLLDTLDDTSSATGDNMHMMPTRELKESNQAIRLWGVKETSRGPRDAMVSFISMWLDDPKSRSYSKLDFLPPPLRCPPDVFNLFTGFAAEKWQVESSEDVSVWLELLELACNGDKISADIVETFFADVIQRGGEPSQCGWSTSSHARGSGKDTLMEVVEQIIGAAYCTVTASPAQELLGDHAVGLLRKLLVHVNESEDLRKSTAKVRHLVTAKTIQVNEKFMRQYNIRNLARWVVTGNDAGLVEVNRRFYATQFSQQRVGDTEFWRRVYAWIADKRNLKAVFDRLKSKDLSGVTNMQAHFRTHTTSAAHMAALRTADPITQFVVYIVQAHMSSQEVAMRTAVPAPRAVTVLTSKAIYADYVSWGECNEWGKGAAPAHTYNHFTQQLAYRYTNKLPGHSEPPLRKVKNIGPARVSGWQVDWACLHKELVRANFMSEAEDEDGVVDMNGEGCANDENDEDDHGL